VGRSVAFSKDGRTIAVGSPGSLSVMQSYPGRVHVYDVPVNENGGFASLGKPIEGKVNGDATGAAVGKRFLPHQFLLFSRIFVCVTTSAALKKSLFQLFPVMVEHLQ